MKKYLNSLEEITKALKEGKDIFEDGPGNTDIIEEWS